jgi:hypothetical protein
MELRLGIVEGRYTPCTARVLCRAMASMPAEEAAGLLREAGVATVSESTLNRIPKAIAARYETEREQINAELRAAEQRGRADHPYDVARAARSKTALSHRYPLRLS